VPAVRRELPRSERSLAEGVMAELPEGLPAKLKIGWRDYTIVCWTHKQGRDANRYAEHDGGGWEIRIDFTYPPREAANSLLHELMHACFQVQALDAADDEERTVTGLANGLSMVWRDNPTCSRG
jgi:hypothetical protein